jgi:hypothetical protein
MTAGVVNRALVAIGIAAVACCGLDASAGAQPQQGHTQQGKDQQKAQKRAQQDQAKAQKQQDQDRQQRQDLTRQHQQALMDRQAQRLDQYRQHLDQQQRVAQQQSTQLQRQHREAHYRYQQLYIADLSRQQLRIQSHGGYDYGRDLYLFEAPTYRYSRGGRSYDTNQFGVDLLRHAVNAGYEQGRFAGLADQQDRWPFNYRNCYGYQDANYGYGGFYVDRLDYNTYFREGFRRGYDDGYYDRSQYGTSANGRPSILASVLGAILVVEGTR